MDNVTDVLAIHREQNKQPMVFQFVINYPEIVTVNRMLAEKIVTSVRAVSIILHQVMVVNRVIVIQSEVSIQHVIVSLDSAIVNQV